MIGVGVVGCGYWGPNLVRNFFECADTRVVAVCDVVESRLAAMRRLYPQIATFTDYRALLDMPEVDAVAIATPVRTHAPLAKQALDSGKHVWIEKPFTASVAEAEKLIELADGLQRTLMVDHVFVYSGAVRKIKDLIDEGRLGRLHYYDSVRVNLGLFQHDVNVLWDLAVHDLAIMDYLLGMRPVDLLAVGIANLAGEPESMAHLTCFLEGNRLGHVHVNWFAPVKIRRTLICGDQQMVVYDDLEPSEKVKVYDKGVKHDRNHLLVEYRAGDMYAPQFSRVEPLQQAVRHFAECIRTGQRPLTDGHAGLRLVTLLQTASESMVLGGKRIAVPWSKQRV